MTEQLKDFERIEIAKWQEASAICPCKLTIYCGLINGAERETCSFNNCPGVFFIKHFSPKGF